MQNHIFLHNSLLINNLKRFAMENIDFQEDAMETIQFPEDAKEKIFYAEPLHAFDEEGNLTYDLPEHVVRANYFYLHGKAEELNGYDICSANAPALSYCLLKGAFLCMVQFLDGKQREAICFSVFEHHRMKGLICLLEDLDGILSCFPYFNIDRMPMLFDHEEKYLDSIGIYEPMKQYVRSINPY